MKHLLSLLFITASFYTYAQKSTEQSKDFYINEEGEKVTMYGEIEVSAQHLYYDDNRGKRTSVAQKKVKVMVAKNRLFLNLPITKNMDRMHELIAFDEKHMLTYYIGESVYYIFDRNNTMIEGRISIPYSPKKGTAVFDEKIAKYFGGCEELMTAMRKNIAAKTAISYQITYFQCGEKDFFED